jgi:hypothetical protein
MPKLVLDPSRENAIPADYVGVDSEVDFLRLDGNSDDFLWVRGETLCRWVGDLYRVRGLTGGEDYSTISSPRRRLQVLLGDNAEKLSSAATVRIIGLLNEFGEMPLDVLLSRLTEDDFWLQSLSRTNAARWLLVHFDEELLALIEVQQQRWVQQCGDSTLKSLYQTPAAERERVLRLWMGSDEANALGVFPFRIEGMPAEVLKEEWGKLLRSTEGAAIEKLSPLNPNAPHIAVAAFQYFMQHAEYLTAERVARISPHLPMPQRSQLEEVICKDVPAPLLVDDAVEHVLAWVVDEYLPYRQWQVRTGNTEAEQKVVELAGSFSEWILHNYPRLTMTSRESSHLNVRVKYVVDRLLMSSPVLWVVVDGLNHINHRRLLRLLAQSDSALGVEEDYALLAALPTVTEQAKFSLTTGLFPGENNMTRRHIKDIFAGTFSGGTYACTRIGDLHAALAEADRRVCYWNMMDIDECYHQQTDPAAAEHNIQARLHALARNISDLVLKSPQKHELAVVICTDHGQMIGYCVKTESAATEVNAHGRMAYGDLLEGKGVGPDAAFGKDQSGSVVVLDPTRFRLNAPTTVALDNKYFGGWREDAAGRAWGVHGGMYPEEVVVGLTVLKHKPVRLPVSAIISGTGEALKPGAFSLTVDNPNRAPISSLMLVLDAVDECKRGLPLLEGVKASGVATISIQTASFPTPAMDDTLELQGTLIYEFEDGVSHSCEALGKFTSKQMYSSQRPSLRDRFKR